MPVKPRWISHLSITKVIGGATANYTIAIDRAGTAHIFGRIPYFGVKDPRQKWNVVSCDEPLHVPPPPGGGKWDGGAVGAGHFLLFSGSAVYGAGDNRANALGVVGNSVACMGLTDSLGETLRRTLSTSRDHGRMFPTSLSRKWPSGARSPSSSTRKGGYMPPDWGSSASSATGRQARCYSEAARWATPTPRLHVGTAQACTVLTTELVKGLESVEIEAIACGDEHALALDDGGFVYVWGRNLVTNLGLGDREDRLEPVRVEQFDHLDVVSIYAGPTSSVVITDTHDESGGRRMWIAGKCKIKGPGEFPLWRR